MIAKPFSSYDITLGLTALKNRISPTHEKYSTIIEELSRYEAGEQGEQYILQLLTENELPKKTYVLHNVQFKSKVDVQIDVLIVTPSFCLVLEVKNIKGILHFKKNPRQLVREEEEGKLQILGSPEIQLEQYCLGLKLLLESMKIKAPIYGVIVFPFNNAIIKTPSDIFPVKIGREIITYLWNQSESQKLIDTEKLVRILSNIPYESTTFPLCNKYEIKRNEIISGVECPQCGTIPMVRTLRTWYCPKCKAKSKEAHLKALADYYMLINNTITNKDCVDFLHLNNHQLAYRLLNECNFLRYGAKRNSMYEIKDFRLLM